MSNIRMTYYQAEEILNNDLNLHQTWIEFASGNMYYYSSSTVIDFVQMAIDENLTELRPIEPELVY